MSKESISLIKSIVIAVILGLLIRNYVFNIASVNGASMENTLHHKDLLFCLSYKKFQEVERDSIVVIKPPIPGEKRKFIKRVIGLPGETVTIKDGQVYIDGKLLDEPYVKDFTPAHLDGDVDDEFVLGDGQYFVMGDNRLNSEDSRAFGPITKKNIYSFAVYRFFPFKSATSIVYKDKEN